LALAEQERKRKEAERVKAQQAALVRLQSTTQPGAPGYLQGAQGQVGPAGEETYQVKSAPYTGPQLDPADEARGSLRGLQVAATPDSFDPFVEAQRQSVNVGGREVEQRNREAELRLQAQLEAEADQRRAGIQAGAETRRLEQVRPFLNPPTVSRAGIAGNEEAARNAAFARAKDQAGATARASLNALRSILSERGIGGAGYEAARTGEIVGGARGELGEFTREQLIQDLRRAGEISDQEYEGLIAQRGQNLGTAQSLLGLINARGLY
jgi:hypothetical protein